MKYITNNDGDNGSVIVEQSFSIDLEEYGQEDLTFEDIFHYLKEFLRKHKLPPEVRLTYMSLEGEKMEITTDFCLSFELIREKYDSSFVILVETKLLFFTRKLDEIMSWVDNLFEELEDVKINA
jgi:hypothetical protein